MATTNETPVSQPSPQNIIILTPLETASVVGVGTRSTSVTVGGGTATNGSNGGDSAQILTNSLSQSPSQIQQQQQQQQPTTRDITSSGVMTGYCF